jgi:hypothetical protein
VTYFRYASAKTHLQRIDAWITEEAALHAPEAA